MNLFSEVKVWMSTACPRLIALLITSEQQILASASDLMTGMANPKARTARAHNHFPLDGHWNPRGHELAAHSLIEYFAKAQDHAGRGPDMGPVENR